MISVTRVCTKCGAEIPADAPEGGCPGCLLESGLRLLDEGAVVPHARDRIDKPAHATRSERLAELLGELGDYELLEEVGRGGQGVVFRARQKSLNRTVALKVINLGQWASEAHLKRFRREAEAAASLDHPSIVPIYEVGERNGSCYFSMKFVEGGQLDEVVKHAPLSIRQSAELIAKVTRTVHYAHEHGILHRDIKPGNILLDKNREPHLTDFGLARLLDTQSSVTRTIDVLGTPSYMAPEQAAGNNTQLTAATDVYGLGAVLYQLLTGQPPFAGGTTYETIRLLRDTEPRPPRFLNPKVDRDLSTICLKCLEKDPQRRYSSALALAEDLEHWLKHEPIQAKPTGVFTHGRKWVRRNPSTTVLVTLLVAFAIGLSVSVWYRKPKVVIPKSVAVLPFENLSDDPNSTYFADGIQEEILTRLAKIADLKVISRASTRRYDSKPGNLAAIAKQLGVANIVEGSVQKAGDQVRVNVQLINAETDSHLWAESYDRRLTDIFVVESEIAKRIAESLQTKLSGQEEQALAVKPTNNPEAYDAYLRGLSFEARCSALGSDICEKAIDSYERAVQLDPNFATAWARLSRVNAHIYFNGFVPHAGYAPRDAAAKRALANAQKLEPNSSETLLALGYYQYWVLSDYGLAKATFQQVGKMLRGSSEVPHALGAIARTTGNWDQSIAHYEQALELDPRNTQLLVDAAMTYSMVRQFSAALKLYDRALDIVPHDPQMIWYKAAIHVVQGNLQEAGKLLSGVNEQTPDVGMFFTKVNQLAFERNYGEALRLMQARPSRVPFHSDFDKGEYDVVLTLIQRFAGDLAGAKITAEQARDTFEPLYRDQPKNAFIARELATVYAVMGEKDSAIRTAEGAAMLVPRAKNAWFAPENEEFLARVLAMVGENRRAISILKQLLQTPYRAPITTALLRLDPIWDPLRADPAFQKLCEDKLDKSIAVLPFENLSGDPNNAYFAEGIQDEILTRLSKIADLKVISRTSTSRYKSKPDNLGKIAKQLGVANILEGSVQKAADQVRVNVQLSSAQTDSHLWAESYDRKLTDVLSVESEIAKRIAESLQAKLSGREEEALAVKPTNNPEAYDAYLRGLAFEARPYSSYSSPHVEKAAGFYARAVQLDPKFSIGWARLSRADAELYFAFGFQATSARRDAAKRALDNAQKLEPNSPETLLALGYYQFRVLRDYGLAKTTFERVNKILPSNSEVLQAIGYVTRREGHWDKSIAYLEQALNLDPRNVELLMNSAENYKLVRQFPAALKLYDRVLDIAPTNPDVMWARAGICQAQGNLQEAAKLLSEINWQSPDQAFYTKVYQLKYERNYREAIRLLQARLAQFHYASPDNQATDQVGLARMQRVAGDTAGAKLTAAQGRKTLEPLYSDQSRAPRARAELALDLSQAYAAMGEKDSALDLAERAIMLLSRAQDPVIGPRYEENLAVIQTIFGENSRAIPSLARLLQTPYASENYGPTGITPAFLSLDPLWDPLRGDPAFQKLCEEKQPPATP